MSFADLIAAADPASADAIQTILDRTLAAAPAAEEGLSYSVAALLLDGKAIIGIGTRGQEYSLYPHSGQIVSQVADLLPGFRISNGSIGFSGTQPIPIPVIDQIVHLRLTELRNKH